jgi:hypothetical protein
MKEVEINNIDYYLVENVPFIKSMYLNGGHVSANQLADNSHSWNLKPVTIGHPKENGSDVSATRPAWLSSHIGFINNTRMDDKKRLKTDMYLRKDIMDADKEKMNLIESIKGGMQIDVSGAYIPSDSKAGVEAILQPDHVAILPNTKGWCSKDDGCGINVNEYKGENMSDLDLGKFKNEFKTELVEDMTEVLANHQAAIEGSLQKVYANEAPNQKFNDEMCTQIKSLNSKLDILIGKNEVKANEAESKSNKETTKQTEVLTNSAPITSYNKKPLSELLKEKN